MRSWHTGRLAAFDTETTGVDYNTARIVTAAVIAVGGDQATTPATWLIDPGVDIPDEAAAIHGVTTAHARTHGRKAPEAIEEIAGALAAQLNTGVPVIAMNARYDLTLLDRELRRHNLTPLADRQTDGAVWGVIDPYVIDKAVDKYRRGKRTLTALCAHYGIKLGADQAHDCSEDALAAARVAYKLAVKFPRVRVALPVLMANQTAWAAEQATALQEYLRTKGGQPDAVVEPAWPLVPYGAGAP